LRGGAILILVTMISRTCKKEFTKDTYAVPSLDSDKFFAMILGKHSAPYRRSQISTFHLSTVNQSITEKCYAFPIAWADLASNFSSFASDGIFLKPSPVRPG